MKSCINCGYKLPNPIPKKCPNCGFKLDSNFDIKKISQLNGESIRQSGSLTRKNLNETNQIRSTKLAMFF